MKEIWKQNKNWTGRSKEFLERTTGSDGGERSTAPQNMVSWTDETKPQQTEAASPINVT